MEHNCLYSIRGVGMTTWAAILFHEISNYHRVALWKNGAASSLVMLMTVGGIFIILAICGGAFSGLYLCNEKCRNRCEYNTYTTVRFALLFSILLIIQSAVTIYMLVITPTSRKDFEEAFKNYNYRWEDREFVDYVQKNLYCCGIDSSWDYGEILKIPVPSSCCNSGVTCTEDIIRLRLGCASKLTFYEFVYGFGYAYKIYALGGFILILTVVELIGFIFALCLANSRRKKKETIINDIPAQKRSSGETKILCDSEDCEFCIILGELCMSSVAFFS
ncbi:PREDICTED: CD63 antigen-like isoform X2 [Wasmannia auropunctata]|uniref:CD63 antigen-like isoform X2 n=1 Tax=Wasmannia auropunctata TaxID=64793 RepID=UPI0005F05C96|nr:PREDICTED: CD63 antigen-like isoform X2 [Wasmannia auropunctata]